MARFHGKIGFAEQIEDETCPGIWLEKVTEREYSGDLLRASRSSQGSSEVMDNLNISNQISILADPYLNENLFAVRYVTFMNTKWKVRNVEVQYPRLVITMGEIYHGDEDTASDASGNDAGEPECVLPTPVDDQDVLSGDCI